MRQRSACARHTFLRARSFMLLSITCLNLFIITFWYVWRRRANSFAERLSCALLYRKRRRSRGDAAAARERAWWVTLGVNAPARIS